MKLLRLRKFLNEPTDRMAVLYMTIMKSTISTSIVTHRAPAQSKVNYWVGLKMMEKCQVMLSYAFSLAKL